MEPLFIDSLKGQIFGVYHAPPTEDAIKGNILFIPPFAEELNRSRHMISRQARSFADLGYGVLILDLYGTGDSQGTFGEATIEIWQADILAAQKWLSEKSKAPLILWAMRTGALLAAAILQENSKFSSSLLLWSPVTNGKKFISQYLRIKLAADLTGHTGAAPLTMKDLWSKLDSGQHLEIAGYDISPALAYGISNLALTQLTLHPAARIKWIETSPTQPATLSPGSQKIINAWQDQSTFVTATAVNDISFWTLQEPAWADAYSDVTNQEVTDWQP